MTPARWRPRLSRTLLLIAEATEDFRDDWWVIGSAAAALVGAEIVEMRDVDLLVSPDDFDRLAARWPEAVVAAAPDGKFRSAKFLRHCASALPVEAFAGFEMNIRDRWRAVAPMTREAHGGVFTPSAAEQIALLETMGRDKDRRRAALLRECIARGVVCGE